MDHAWKRMSQPLLRRTGSLFRHHRLGLYILAVLVGLTSGLGAVLFRMGIDTWSQLLTGADDYTVFLRDSQDCLARLITAIEDDDVARIMHQIARNRALLAGLSQIGGRTIETTELSRLVEIALDHGATAKSSGAGGGDCGIALCPPATDLVALRAAWETAGIRPLDLSVYSQDSSAACAADAAEARADSSTVSPIKVTP